MSKSTTTIQINHDNAGKVTFTQNGRPPGVLEISDDVDLEIQLGTGFAGASAQVTSMELFQDVSGGKGKPVGTWQRNNPSLQPSGELSITAKGNNILVTDTNTTGADDCFFFSVTATDGNRSYSSDPELKVKKRIGNR
jgi:hypothetical protein